MEKFTFDILQNAVGQSIEVFLSDSDQKVADLEITKVTRSNINNDDYDAFSVTLAGKAEEHCNQGNYKFKNALFGEQELFMCPHAVDQYQIVVSRKKE